jgi:hypothetical protein
MNVLKIFSIHEHRGTTLLLGDQGEWSVWTFLESFSIWIQISNTYPVGF